MITRRVVIGALDGDECVCHCFGWLLDNEIRPASDRRRSLTGASSLFGKTDSRSAAKTMIEIEVLT